jgi:dihydrofolate reductase
MINNQTDKSQEVILIAAMAENRVIGKDNTMPWSIKGNLAHFKETTMGWPCIMGRKTWESLPKKPLQGRLNIIISNSIDVQPASAPLQDTIVFSSFIDAIEHCINYEKIFICGGESIYKQALPLANKIELSLIPGNYEGDTYFPDFENTTSGDICWIKTGTKSFENFSVITYTKKNQNKELL